MLQETDLDPDPLLAVGSWFRGAVEAGLELPEAMALATADAHGRPSARMVLLRGIDGGLVFYTNRESRKGRELAANPRAAAVLHWQPLGRQVRAEGPVEQLGEAESQAYFDTRPRQSRLSAWASPQSRPVSVDELAAAVQRETARFAGQEHVPVPPFWGGYRLRPERIEFWQQGADRLHDRIVYQRDGDGWRRHRLAP